MICSNNREGDSEEEVEQDKKEVYEAEQKRDRNKGLHNMQCI